MVALSRSAWWQGYQARGITRETADLKILVNREASATLVALQTPDDSHWSRESGTLRRRSTGRTVRTPALQSPRGQSGQGVTMRGIDPRLLGLGGNNSAATRGDINPSGRPSSSGRRKP